LFRRSIPCLQCRCEPSDTCILDGSEGRLSVPFPGEALARNREDEPRALLQPKNFQVEDQAPR